jgi:hypothetical protein
LEGITELGIYLNSLNLVPDMPRDWTAGNAVGFTPPPIIITRLGDIAWVVPPIQGVITYDLIDLSNLTVAGIDSFSIWAINQREFMRLILQTTQAAQLAMYGAA